MKVEAIKLFGDGKRLYNEGEVFEKSKEWVDMINSTPNAPLVKVIETTSENKINAKNVEAKGKANKVSSSKVVTKT